MAKGNPVIVTGNRSPGIDAQVAAGVTAQPPVATAASTARPGVRRYASSFPANRLTLVDTKNRMVDNKVIAGERIVAVFENGGYETDDPRKQALIETSNQWKRKQIWNADEMVAVAEKAKDEAALKLVMDNPRLQATLRERLAIKEKSDFKLPPPAEEQDQKVAATA